MSHSQFQKMILIPEDASAQMASSVTSSVSQQTRLDQEMSDVLQRNDLSIEQKWKLYQQALHRYLQHTPPSQKPIAIPLLEEKGTTKSLPLFSVILDSVPKTLLRKTSTLLNLLLSSNRISWDQTGEVTIDGNVLSGSNIIDLVHEVVRTRASKHPVGITEFKRFLESINVPKELVSFQFGTGAPIIIHKNRFQKKSIKEKRKTKSIKNILKNFKHYKF